jgi:hypothetical protein
MSSSTRIKKLGSEPHQLTVEGYENENYYTSYWQSEQDYEVILDFCDRHSPSPEASATIKGLGEPKHMDFEVVEKHISDETNLLRIDD